MTIDLSVVRGRSPEINAKTQSRKDAEAPSELSPSNAIVAGEFDALRKPLRTRGYAKFRSEMPGITAFYGILRHCDETRVRGKGVPESSQVENFPYISTYLCRDNAGEGG